MTVTETVSSMEIELIGTATIAVLGILANTLIGTLFGTFVQATITADGELQIVMTCDSGKDETKETGTTTGLDQDEGTKTVAGTQTKLEAAIVTTAELGTLEITEVGTDSGIFVQATIATEGLDAKTIT